MASEVHCGHRARLLHRLLEHAESLQDHELLEIVLFNVIPRKNTNEIAHALIREFGSLAGVFHADAGALCSVEGVGAATAAYLRCVALVLDRAENCPMNAFPRLHNYTEFSKLISERLRPLKYECIELFAADRCGYVIGTERFSSQEHDFALLQPAQIIRFFSKYHPESLLIAHNHLDYGCNPSHDDDLFTRKMQMICNLHGIRLFDHVIVSGPDFYSYYLNQRFDYIKQLPVDL